MVAGQADIGCSATGNRKAVAEKPAEMGHQLPEPYSPWPMEGSWCWTVQKQVIASENGTAVVLKRTDHFPYSAMRPGPTRVQQLTAPGRQFRLVLPQWHQGMASTPVLSGTQRYLAGTATGGGFRRSVFLSSEKPATTFPDQCHRTRRRCGCWEPSSISATQQ